MTRADLLALAERVERATGPDRELDVQVLQATRPDDFRAAYWNARACLNRDLGEAKADAEARRRMRPIAYTASLDAAASLVPEGCRLFLLSVFDDRCTAKIIRVADSMFVGNGNAATEPLARTAAALRALLAERDTRALVEMLAAAKEARDG